MRSTNLGDGVCMGCGLPIWDIAQSGHYQSCPFRRSDDKIRVDPLGNPAKPLTMEQMRQIDEWVRGHQQQIMAEIGIYDDGEGVLGQS